MLRLRCRPGPLRLASALLLALILAACVPFIQDPGDAAGEPAIETERFLTADGLALPLTAWHPDGPPTAVVLALHGFNDYRQAFDLPGRALARAGIVTYAYDQRGFGAAPKTGVWPGTEALVADALAAARLVRQRHPGLPLYLMGESMGGAVALIADVRAPVAPDGLILVAPAVWGRAYMDALPRVGLWIAAHTIPLLAVSGQGLHIRPTDNVEVLRAMQRDPLVQKFARIDALWGLVDLMDAAVEAAPKLTRPMLLLYGLKDDIVPKRPTLGFIDALPPPPAGRWRVALYPKGYHMLLRDLEGDTVDADIVHWIAAPDAPLPSSADEGGVAALRRHMERKADEDRAHGKTPPAAIPTGPN